MWREIRVVARYILFFSGSINRSIQSPPPFDPTQVASCGRRGRHGKHDDEEEDEETKSQGPGCVWWPGWPAGVCRVPRRSAWAVWNSANAQQGPTTRLSALGRRLALRCSLESVRDRIARVPRAVVCVCSPGLVLTRIDPPPHNAHTDSDGRWHFRTQGVGSLTPTVGSSSRRVAWPRTSSFSVFLTSSEQQQADYTLSLVHFCRPAPCDSGGDFFVDHGRCKPNLVQEG